MSSIRLPDDWLWVRAYSPYDISRYLLVQAVRDFDVRVTAINLRRAAHSVGLDAVEDRVYHMVWKDVVHNLLSEYQDAARARNVEHQILT